MESKAPAAFTEKTDSILTRFQALLNFFNSLRNDFEIECLPAVERFKSLSVELDFWFLRRSLIESITDVNFMLTNYAKESSIEYKLDGSIGLSISFKVSVKFQS